MLENDPIVSTTKITCNVSISEVDGVNLALCNGGANGCTKSMKILSYNTHEKRVSISIVGDHQSTGARLCTGVVIDKSNIRLLKLTWNHSAEITKQTNSITFYFQVRS